MLGPTLVVMSSTEEVELLSRVQLCNPMDCSLPGSSVHGIFQARILEWVAISFSWGSSQPRDRTQVSCIVGRCFLPSQPLVHLMVHIKILFLK